MLPIVVNIAGIEYTVEQVDNLIKENNLMGRVTYADSRICIDSSMSESKKEQVFVHELMHAIFNEAGLDEQNDEDVVNRVSIVLYQVLKNNKLTFGNNEEPP